MYIWRSKWTSVAHNEIGSNFIKWSIISTYECMLNFAKESIIWWRILWCVRRYENIVVFFITNLVRKKLNFYIQMFLPVVITCPYCCKFKVLIAVDDEIGGRVSRNICPIPVLLTVIALPVSNDHFIAESQWSTDDWSRWVSSDSHCIPPRMQWTYWIKGYDLGIIQNIR